MGRAEDAVPMAPAPLRWRVFRVVASALSIVVGAGMVAIAFTVGSCGAFGGTCPSTPGPILADDTFGIAALGAGLSVAVPVFLSRPSTRRLLPALAWGAGAGVVVGLLARSGA